MKILLVGCSFVNAEHSWAYYVVQQYPESYQASAPAAGNFFISTAVQDCVLKEDFDLVLVMWSGYTRLDIPTQWAEKRLENYNFCFKTDPHKLIINDWIFSGSLNGSWSGSRDPDIYNMFFNSYKEMNLEHMAYLTLKEIISTQNLLKSKNIPYYFMTYINYWDGDRPNKNIKSFYYDSDHPINEFTNLNYLVKEIDWTKWIFDQGKNGIYERCLSLDDLADDKIHPSGRIHEVWAEKVLDIIGK